MTIGGIIVFILLTLIVGGIGGYITYCCFEEDQGGSAVVTAIITVILIIAMWIGGIWYYTSTEAGKRAVKSQDSNIHGGIEREVIVYDMDGDEIERFRGRFDVDYSDERIMFDDENGNRHVIYFKSGTVIVNEIGGDV